MSIVRQLLPVERRSSPSSTVPGPMDDPTAAGDYAAGFRNRSGVVVTTDTAMRLSTWWRCVNLLADLVSGLPFQSYLHQNDIRVRTDDPPLVAAPSAEASPLDWRRLVLVSWLTRGNAYGIVSKVDSEHRPQQIDIINPDWVTANRVGTRGPIEWRVEGRPVDLFPYGDLWHVPAYLMPGSPLGLSPVMYAKQTVGLGLAAQGHGASWFGEGAHPTAILQSDAEINREQAATIKRRFIEAVRFRREPVVLGAGIKYEAIQVSADESQFLDTIKANVADVARFFGMPPELVGGESGGSLTYANVEQRGLDLLTYTVHSWVIRLEQAVTAQLKPPTFVKANIDALLRVDSKTRSEIAQINVRNGRWSVDDWRRMEDEAPLPDGKGAEYLWPPYRAFPLLSDQGDPT